MEVEYITPNWPLSKKVKAYSTTCNSGYSTGAYSSLNLATHTGDDYTIVCKNRELVYQQLKFPNPPLWINQIHSSRIIQVPLSQELQTEYQLYQQLRFAKSKLYDSNTSLSQVFDIDAVYTDQVNQVCAILTADCVPILLCNSLETEVCAVHAGWQGIVNGIVQNSVYAMKASHNNNSDDYLYAWIGPCIGPKSFEVGAEVMLKFIKADKDFARCFTPHLTTINKWMGDLPAIVTIILEKCGVRKENIYYSDLDTFTDERFFSYRQDNKKLGCGRFATVIWLEKNN